MDLQSMTDSEIVEWLYAEGHEDTRLNRSQSKRVEFLTNVRYIEKYLRPGMKILDVGAGAGEYSLYFARKGYRVSALELAEGNLKAFRAKLRPTDDVDLVQGNALDLSRYDEASFDGVLLFGPLYHLRREEDRLQCIAQAKRVCKRDGKLFFAFISNDFVILSIGETEMQYLKENYGYYTEYTLAAGTYDKQTEDATTVAVKATLIAADTLSEDTVYNVTKGIFENIEAIKATHAKGAELSADSGVQGISVPFHPGAEKYFKEIGKLN